MIKKISIPIVLPIVGGILLLFPLSSCNNLNGPEVKEFQHSFSYEIYNENGEIFSQVTHEHIDGTDNKTSAGLFGKDFLPPRILESIAENTGLDPDELKDHEIYLHAEVSSGEAVQSSTLKFQFPRIQQWESGNYQLPSISKEDYLTQLKRLWALRQNHHTENPSESSGQIRIERVSSSGVMKETVTVDYSESGIISENSYGLRIDSTGIYYQSLGGEVELTNVSDKLIEGSFTVEVAGFPMKFLFFSDEFPENPELQIFHITGNFATVYGDYQDLIQSSEKILLF